MISVDNAAADDATEECTKDAGWHRYNNTPAYDAVHQHCHQHAGDCPDQIRHCNYGVVGAAGCSGDAGWDGDGCVDVRCPDDGLGTIVVPVAI